MEHFGKKFQAGQIASWKDRYTNYADLKSYIKEQSTSNNAQMNKSKLISSFTSKLDKELKKVYMFFVQNERELYIQINSRLHLRKGYYSLDGNGIEKEFDELIKIANYTTDLTKYISDNVMAFVKILDKFDKKFHNINTNLSSTYIVEKLEMKNSDLLYIFQFKIIDEVSALLEDLQNDLLAVFSKLTPSGNNQPELQQNLINSSESKGNVSLSAIENKSNAISTKIHDIDEYYKGLQAQYKTWNRILKQQEFQISSSKTNSNDIEMGNSLAANTSAVSGKDISEANQWNVWLTLMQKFYMAACSTLIFSNYYGALTYYYAPSTNNIEYYSSFALAMTPLGGIVSMLFTKYIIIKSYKIPMIISAVLAVIGNFLYILGVGYDSIVFQCISRLLIGFALNTRVHRKYLLEFIPKRKISKYLLALKACFLLGNTTGPILTLIFCLFPKRNHDDVNSLFIFNEYTNPSWLCTVLAIIILLLICIYYAEPVSSSFNAYAEGQTPLEAASRTNSFSLDGAFTNNESDALKQLNDKLSEFNEQNQFSDTNLVSSSIDNIMIRERGPGNTISNAFTIILLNIFFSNIISMSLLVNTPMHIHDEIEKIGESNVSVSSDQLSSLILTLAMFAFVVIYFFNFVYVSGKIDKILYILILDFIIVCIEGGMMFTVQNSRVFLYSILFIFTYSFCYLLEDTTIYFFTKIIPTDYRALGMSAPTGVQFFGYFGMVLGCLLGLIGLISDLTKSYIVILGVQVGLLVIIAIIGLLFKNQFQEKAIRRIFRHRNTNKIRRTEF